MGVFLFVRKGHTRRKAGPESHRGKAVKIRYGHATVIGDESRRNPLAIIGWEGAASRMIHKSGNLPG